MQQVQLCVLFGSQATGKVHSHSDVDLALKPAQPLEPQQYLRWQGQLEDLFAADVSLVIISPDLNPTLGFEIVRQGCLIFEAEAGLWDQQQLNLWHAYNDSEPFRRAARESYRKFTEEVRRGEWPNGQS
jgi:predicted nucleotidyltransferase